jgi:hypothetical protein
VNCPTYTDPIYAQQSAEGPRSLPKTLKPADLSAALQDGTVAWHPDGGLWLYKMYGTSRRA